MRAGEDKASGHAEMIPVPLFSFEVRGLGTMKYILVTGGVVSGLGKGVTASSIGVLLKACGVRVTSIKIGTCGVGVLCMWYWPDWRAGRAPEGGRAVEVFLRGDETSIV